MKDSIGVEIDATGGAVTDQVIYTVPTGYHSLVSMFFLSNTGGSTTTVGGAWNDGVSVPFLAGKSLAAGDHLQFGGTYGAWLAMEEGDTISVSVASGGTCAAILSFELIRKGMN